MTKRLHLSFTIEVSEDIDDSEVLDALLEVIPGFGRHLDDEDINVDLAEETATVSGSGGMWKSEVG